MSYINSSTCLSTFSLSCFPNNSLSTSDCFMLAHSLVSRKSSERNVINMFTRQEASKVISQAITMWLTTYKGEYWLLTVVYNNFLWCCKILQTRRIYRIIIHSIGSVLSLSSWADVHWRNRNFIKFSTISCKLQALIISIWLVRGRTYCERDEQMFIRIFYVWKFEAIVFRM